MQGATVYENEIRGGFVAGVGWVAGLEGEGRRSVLWAGLLAEDRLGDGIDGVDAMWRLGVGVLTAQACGPCARSSARMRGWMRWVILAAKVC
jgi:hypothetical protein